MNSHRLWDGSLSLTMTPCVLPELDPRHLRGYQAWRLWPNDTGFSVRLLVRLPQEKRLVSRSSAIKISIDQLRPRSHWFCAQRREHLRQISKCRDHEQERKNKVKNPGFKSLKMGAMHFRCGAASDSSAGGVGRGESR